ncbi:Nucleoporin Nup43 [Phytophthora citrophthora]|uniref:Nucleoporin Nup43 n=1 Tax=Phytophthora citrophthora TaxID=4793 RepID=A0AAD9LCL0_9STRA|nr:Nucleoporin Nup43 [Phytophthora citrophthora]
MAHFLAEKVKAVCVVSDVRYASETLQEDYDVLPLVATGGWDNETNHVSLHLPVRRAHDERELRKEFGRGEGDAHPCELSTLAEAEHEGDVNALQFVASRDENLLVSASSAGGVYAYRVSSSAGEDEAMSDADSSKPLSAFAVPQWEKVFAGSAATCVEVSDNRMTLVTASASGALAWLKLDEVMSVEILENKDTSRLPINAVKFLGQDSVVATVGSTPGSQLRIWDITANNQFPVMSCADPSSRSILTTLETHPTRPELLITGADDGRVEFWDRRKLEEPLRTEAYHQRAVRALKLHSASPRYLYTGGDDSVVNCWDFHHGRNPRDAVEYERYSGPAGNQNLTPFASLGTSNGFSKGLQVQRLCSGTLPWNALAVHAESDTLVAGSDAQSLVIVQQVSKWKQ